MRKILIALMLCVGAMALTGCDRVSPGEVGILVNKTGSDKGVGDVVGVGRYWTGWNTNLYTFPTFKQMKSYDDPFYFQMSDGTTIGYHIGLAYKVDPTKVSTVFQTYRKGVDDITESDMKQKISDVLNAMASRMSTDKFIDGGKTDMINESLHQLQTEMGPVGIQIMSLSYQGRPEYPPTVIASINAKVTANQTTLQRNQEILQREAEANMARAQAAGEADVKRAQAQADADAVLVKATAEAKAIDLRGAAIQRNPSVLQLNTIEKWSGNPPQYIGGGSAVPVISVPSVK